MSGRWPVLHRRQQKRVASALVATTLTVTTLFALSVTADVAGSTGNATSSWTVYHGDAAGTGVSTVLRRVTTSKRAWSSAPLNGQLYGEPLVFGNRVFVATENDVVYALSSTNGRVLWSRHVASAVPSSRLPCGDISPVVGITGTPVIDPSKNEIFVVADELIHGGPEHVLLGLSATSGAIEMTRHVDPPGADPAALLQRTGLNLDAGRVIFAMGGNYGDCAAYRGRVVAVGENGAAPIYFTVDARAGDSQGAIWMGGAAPEVDARGNVWVSVGNGSVYSNSQPYDDSDSTLELSSTLRRRQFFAPATWAQDNRDDYDMTTAPVLFPNGQVLQAGKSPSTYLLNGSHLGGIGNEEATVTNVCTNDIDGGSAVVGTTVYLPCLSGPVAVRATAAPYAIKVLWRASVGGGPPLMAAGLIWTISPAGVLYGLDPATGHVRQRATVGAPANHFPTPSVGDGLLLATSSTRVVAFRASLNS